MKATSLFLLSCLFCAPAFAEELTTGNLAPGMEDFTTSGGTSYGTGHGCNSGAYCTSGTTGGGGTYTSSFDVPLTEAEINQGFTLNSALTIHSHSSNAQLSTCANGVLQSGDCRDIFTLTITLQDAGTTVETFTHEEEMDFAGLQDFTFADVVATNSYGALTGILELFGIDAGYPTGFYGPQFSNPSLTIDYQTAFVQEEVQVDITDYIETETQDIIQATTATTAPTETFSAPVVAALPTYTVAATSAPPPAVSATSTVSETVAPASAATPATPAPPPEPVAPTIQPIAPVSETQQEQESQAEAEIEAAVEPAPKATSKSTKPAARRKAATASASSEVPVSAPVTPAIAAQAVVDAIAPSQKYGAAAQTVTLVAMGIIAQNRGLFKGPGIPDAAKGFFSTSTMPDGPSMVDRMTNYRFSGQASAVHNALVESQWSK
tara:strand:+ start:378 stop:1685 length:1308 start_codon:yes stop_codon:yes gene_type:complete